METSAIRNLTIAYNYIHDVMQELADGGAIYMLGGSGGTEDNPNLVYDNYIKNQEAGSAALYTDEGTSFYKYYRNVIDQTESTMPDLKWTMSWVTHIFNNTLVHNYTTSPNYDKNGTDMIVEDILYYPDANWPDEAMEIIANSGVEEEYRYMVPQSDTFCTFTVKSSMELEEGKSMPLNLKGFTDHGKQVDMGGASISYQSDNPDIASVDETGVVTAHTPGNANITTSVTFEGVSKERVTPAYVEDEFHEIIFTSGDTPTALVGSTKELLVSGMTRFGRECTLDEVSYESSEPTVAAIDNSGVITALALGSTEISVTATFEGVTKTKTYTLDVVDYADQSGLDYPTTSMSELLQAPEDWYVDGAGSVTKIGQGLRFNTPAGFANYTAKKYENELFSCKMTIDASDGWPSVGIRNQKEDGGLDTLYLISFTPTEIQLQRFNDGERTVIFANVAAPNIGGAGLPNNVVGFGKTYDLEFGAVNEDGGVRIILNIDGVNILNFLDKTEGKIEEPGYVSVFSRSGTMDLTEG